MVTTITTRNGTVKIQANPSANQRYGYNYGQTQYQPGHFLEKGLIQNLQQQIRQNSFQMKNILERIEAMQSHYKMARIPHLIPSQLQNQTQMGQIQNPMAMQTQQMNQPLNRSQDQDRHPI